MRLLVGFALAAFQTILFRVLRFLSMLVVSIHQQRASCVSKFIPESAQPACISQHALRSLPSLCNGVVYLWKAHTHNQTLAHKTREIMTTASTTSSMLNLTGGTDAWGISSCLFGNASQAVGCESESGLLR